MNRLTAVLCAGLLTLLGAGVYVWTVAAGEDAIGTMPEKVDLKEGQRLYGDYCAACHGANLEGQDNWQIAGEEGRLPAPPHDETGHTWHHGDQVLFEYTKLGGRALMAAQGMEFDSGMPGFEGQLEDQQIWNILGYIKSTWSERVQEIQAVRTEGESRKRGN